MPQATCLCGAGVEISVLEMLENGRFRLVSSPGPDMELSIAAAEVQFTIDSGGNDSLWISNLPSMLLILSASSLMYLRNYVSL